MATNGNAPGPRKRRERLMVALAAATAGVVALGVWVLGRGSPASESAIRSALEGRRWAEAELLLADWVARHPRDGRARLRLGSVLGMLGRDSEAADTLGRVDARDAAWPRAQVLLGEMALKGSDAVAAETAFRAAADRDPTATAPRTQLLALLLIERRTEESRAVLWELERLTGDPRHVLALTGLALADDQSGQLRELGSQGERFREYLDRFLAHTPDDPWLRRARGLTLFQIGHPADALRDLERSVGEMEDDPALVAALAECRLQVGDLAGVEATLAGVPPARPAAASRWWRLKGQAAAASGRMAAAIDAWRKAVGADPRARVALYQLGTALKAQGQDAEARRALERAEEIRVRTEELKRLVFARRDAPDDAGAYETLGRLCLDAGMAAEGRAWLKQAIRVDSYRRSAQLALAPLGAVEPPMQRGPRPRRAPVAAPTAAPTTAPPADAPGPRFEDEAEQRGLVARYDPAARGDLFIGDTMGGGVGLIDYDGDGWLDAYLVNGCPLPVDPRNPPAPNRLFRNNGDGTFADVTTRAGVGGRGYGMGCAVGDYDGDGHDDLFVTGLGSTVLYHNNGDGTFTDVTVQAGVSSTRWCTAAGFGDLDGDGDLDLVVVTYVEADPERPPVCRDATGHPIHCPPGRFPAQTDHLFRNNGDGSFTDVAAEAGLDVPDGRGLGLAVADLDGDGRLDLFVANDAVPDFLFRNLGGLRFEEVGVSSGAALDGTGRATASMGVVAADLDGDGRLDLLHTNFTNEGSTLLHNLGGGLFMDTTARSGLDAPSRPMTGFGVAELDADNDGRLDLFVANGHVDEQPWIRQPMAQRPQLFLARGDGRFALAPRASAAGLFERPAVGRGVAAGDLDNDGRVDLVVVRRDAPVALLHNVSRGGHWLTVRLVGSRSPRTPVGARVTCRTGTTTQTRWLTTGTSYLSAHDARLHFGLGAAGTVDELVLAWPSGAVQRWSGVTADRVLRIHEGQDVPGAHASH